MPVASEGNASKVVELSNYLDLRAVVEVDAGLVRRLPPSLRNTCQNYKRASPNNAPHIEADDSIASVLGDDFIMDDAASEQQGSATSVGRAESSLDRREVRALDHEPPRCAILQQRPKTQCSALSLSQTTSRTTRQCAEATSRMFAMVINRWDTDRNDIEVDASAVSVLRQRAAILVL